MATKIRLTTKDKSNLVAFIKDEQRTRANSKFRKSKENIWREIDRQIEMEPPPVRNRSGRAGEDWHNAIQLGHLADALEVHVADVMRLTFPVERKWFHPHINLGPEEVDVAEQRKQDAILRSFMVQQQSDFGFRDRVKLSVSEAFKHGGFVATAEWKTQQKFHSGSRRETLSAPVWNVFSMWDSFPDPSPEVQGTDLFYQGSMIVTKKWRAAKARKMPGWRAKDIVEDKDKMTDLTFFWGDAIIRRSMSDLWFPNRFIVLSGGNIVFTQVNETPYSPVIYTGYEKDDCRNPYYTSPLIKRSPSLNVATRSANKFLDAVDVSTEPPIEYDRISYPYSAPDFSPGAMNQVTGGSGARVIATSDPLPSLQGLQMGIDHVQQGTGVDQVRTGVGPNTEQTAFEVDKRDQRSEVREVEFVGTLERQGLLPFLYMQFELNRLKLEQYNFYNDERTTPDYLTVRKADLPTDGVRFEVTGSKQVLGELNRSQKLNAVNSFALSNEFTAAKIDIDEVLLQAYSDSGAKDPERFLLDSDDDDGQQQQIQEAVQAAQQQMIQEVQPKIEALQKQLAQAQAQTEVGMERLRMEMELKAQKQQAEIQESAAEQARKDEESQREQDRKDAETQAKIEQSNALTQQKLDQARIDSLIKENQSKDNDKREVQESKTPNVVILKREST